jgi:hypothetical protein
MGLTYDDWITELEDALESHIDTYVTTDVQILKNAELPRSFTKPVITIAQFDGTRRNTGGMNAVGGGEQGYWEEPSYYITVNTDDSDSYSPNAQLGRNKVASELEYIAFGSQLHQFKAALDGAAKATVRPVGPTLSGGPTGDRQIYQYAFFLEIETLISFTSLVL